MTTTTLVPHISFREDARHAMEHYRSFFGGRLRLTTWAEMPMDPSTDPAGHLVLHSRLDINDRMAIEASDSPAGQPHETGNAFTLSVGGSAAEADTVRAWWDALADGGTVVEPFEPAPWGDTFGRVTDRFGIHWVFNLAAATR